MKRLFLVAVLASALLAVLGAGTPSVAAPLQQYTIDANATPTHYIVFERDQTGATVPVFHTIVQIDTSRRALDINAYNTQMAQGRMASPTREGYIGVVLRDAAGNVAYRTVVDSELWIRSEAPALDHAHDDHIEIEGSFFQSDNASFVVRVPVIAGTQLELEDGVTRQVTRYNPNVIANDTNLRLRNYAPPIVQANMRMNGDPSNRIDMVLLGEGYTTSQEAKFNTDVATFNQEFFNITPYDEYRNYVNVAALQLNSAQSGVDQPPYCTGGSCDPGPDPFAPTLCTDFDADGKTNGGFVDTALDATMCGFQTWRLMVVDESKAFAAAAAYPEFDEVLVMVNTEVYGGAGGPLGTFSLNEFAILVAQHEYGHSFTDLADEYTTPNPGFPPCSDIDNDTSNDCELNVTDETVRENLKWNRWLEEGVPIPTTGAEWGAPDQTGLWEGARYQSTGMYRPSDLCMMNVLINIFCEVPSEAYALKLYNNDSGDSISLIEPATATPNPGDVIIGGEETTLSATLLGPQSGPDLDVDWVVNGNIVAEATVANAANATLDLATVTEGTGPGLNEIELQVRDVSTIIHPDNLDVSLSTQSWFFYPTNMPPREYPVVDAQLDGTSTWSLFTFEHVEGVEWYGVWVGSEDYSQQVLYQWFPAFDDSVSSGPGQGICDSVANTCTLPTDLWLTNGTYRWWMSYWGDTETLRYLDLAWNETQFTVQYPTPAAITSRAPSGTVSSATTLSWDHDPGALWYQIWLGAADYSSTDLYKWFDARDICTETTCTITLVDEDATLASGDYEWWMEVWGPAAYQDWTANGPTNFTLSP